MRVQIGQTVTFDLVVTGSGAAAQPPAAQAEALLGHRPLVRHQEVPWKPQTVQQVAWLQVGGLVETRTSEVATNVTTEQIDSLHQNNRNFLNFAALAPGVRVNDRDTAKNFQAGALSANAVNVTSTARATRIR